MVSSMAAFGTAENPNTQDVPEVVRDQQGSIMGMMVGSFRKLGVPYLGVLIVRILLFRVLY